MSTVRRRAQPSRRLHPLTKVANDDAYSWATTRWLRRLIYERGLTYYKVGGKVLIDLNDLDRLVETGRRGPR
jgi:excisionase family DNA binding protein